MKIFLASLTLTLSFSAHAVNLENGDELHFDNCTGCHTDELYQSPKRKINTLPKLGKQVRFCQNALGISWFDDETNDVIHYLNEEFYQFK